MTTEVQAPDVENQEVKEKTPLTPKQQEILNRMNEGLKLLSETENESSEDLLAIFQHTDSDGLILIWDAALSGDPGNSNTCVMANGAFLMYALQEIKERAGESLLDHLAEALANRKKGAAENDADGQ